MCPFSNAVHAQLFKSLRTIRHGHGRGRSSPRAGTMCCCVSSGSASRASAMFCKARATAIAAQSLDAAAKTAAGRHSALLF
jgi:hypothetical protein